MYFAGSLVVLHFKVQSRLLAGSPTSSLPSKNGDFRSEASWLESMWQPAASFDSVGTSMQGERHLAQELRGIGLGTYEVPEWKKQALGKAPTFGMRDTRSIKDQRESLPIFKMREELLKGLTANQVTHCSTRSGSSSEVCAIVLKNLQMCSRDWQLWPLAWQLSCLGTDIVALLQNPNNRHAELCPWFQCTLGLNRRAQPARTQVLPLSNPLFH